MENNISLELKIMLLLVLFTILQDFIFALMFTHHLLGVTPIKIIYLVKDIFVIVLGLYNIIVILKRKKLIASDVMPLLFLVYLLPLFFVNEIGLFNKLLSARTYIIPILLYFIGRNIGTSRVNLDYIKKFMINISLFIAISSLVERYLLPISFWENTVNLSQFNTNVKGMINLFTLGDLVGNFYTGGIRRTIGLFGDPLFLSYFLIPIFFFLLCLFGTGGRKKTFTFILLTLTFLVQLTTLTRAVIISEIVTLIFGLFILNFKTVISNKRYLIFIFSIVFLACFSFEMISEIFIKTISFQDGGSALTHVDSLKNGINLLSNNLFGKGLGTASTAVAAVSNAQGAENSYINLGVELGIPGLLLFILFWLIVILNCYNICNFLRNRRDKMYYIYLAIFLSSLAFMISGFFSPELWTMKTMTFYWLLVGLLQREIDYQKKFVIKKRKLIN